MQGQGEEKGEDIKKEKTGAKPETRDGAIKPAPSSSVSLYDHLVSSLSAIR